MPLYKFFPRASLVNIYRAFVRPHLDYGDIIYDNSSNAIFSQMKESVQYNAALAITAITLHSARDKLYQDGLGNDFIITFGTTCVHSI